MWFPFSINRSRGRRRRGAGRAPATQRLRVEALEDRSLPSFLAPVSYAVGNSPAAVASADFNGDGKLDLATANQQSNTISILLGNGNGTFRAASNFATGSAPRSVAVGDFNGDGKLDIVTANSNNLSLLPGNGDGTFQAPASIGMGAFSVAAGDFNADGKLDLAVTSHSAFTDCYYDRETGDLLYCDVTDTRLVQILLGSGDGTFAASATYQLDSSYFVWYGVGPVPEVGYFDVEVGDVNGDGMQDVVLGGGLVLLGNGDGTLQYHGPVSAGAASDLKVGDVNRDGRPDLVMANSGGNSVSVTLGNGDGTFQVARSYATGTQPRSVTIADFNADGKPDLVTANNGGNNVSVLLGVGDGTFKPPINSAAGSGPVAVTAGDFNADGLPDAAVANYSAGTVSVLLNAGNWPALNAPSISISDVTKLEGNSGKTLFVFTFSLSAAYDQPVTVHFATADGTATVADQDYIATSGTLTFAPGETAKTITVMVKADRNVESDETFFVKLSDATNAFIADDLGIGTILNDDKR